MKKRSLLAIFMVLVLCMSMMLAGCQEDETSGGNKETVADADEKELTAQEAMDNTLAALRSDRITVPVLEDMSEKKVITVAMDGLFSNVLNLDAANRSFYDELSVGLEGQTVTGQLYCDGKDLALTCPELMGEAALGINFATFADDLKTSGLLDLLMAELGGDLSELEGVLSEYSQSLGTMNADAEEIMDILEEVAQGMQSSKADGTANIYGAEVKAVVFTYAMDKDDYKKMIDLFLDMAEEAYQADLDAMISAGTISPEEGNPYSDAKAEIDAIWGDAEMSGTMNLYANPENGCMMLMESTYTGTVEGETLEAVMTLTLGEDPAAGGKYVLALDMNLDETETIAMEMALTSTTEGSTDTTVFTFDAEVDGEKMDVMTFTAVYDYNSAAYELALEAESGKITAKGTMDSTEDKFIIIVDELEAEGETLPLGITVSVENDPDCEIPAVPAYTNALTDLGLTEMLETYLYGEYEDDTVYEGDTVYED